MKSSRPGKPADRKTAGERIEILYEDRYLVVLCKPAGLLSVPFPGFRGKTAVDLLCAIRQKRGLVSAKTAPLAVHRLDRETSGVMMFALTQNARLRIMNTWNTMVTERLYRALAENPVSSGRHGRHMDRTSTSVVLADEGCLDAPLAYNAQHRAYVPDWFAVPDSVPDAQSMQKYGAVAARTGYRILERGARYTLFDLSLDTGRKNQIRAHLAHSGYPVAGDDIYGARTNPAGRLCLHARTLAFIHPFTGETLRFEVPEPALWSSFLK